MNGPDDCEIDCDFAELDRQTGRLTDSLNAIYDAVQDRDAAVCRRILQLMDGAPSLIRRYRVAASAMERVIELLKKGS